MGLFRRVGRAIGRGVEWAGKVMNSKTLQVFGKGIQKVCAETAKETGNTREYNSETASFEDTQHIAKILADFHDMLEPQAKELEQECREVIDSYFSELIRSLSMLIENKRVDKKLRNRQKTIIGSISNVFGIVLSQRVSLADNECKRILEMPQGVKKEEAMSAFGEKVIEEGKSQLCKNVKTSIAELNEEISEELDGIVEKQALLVRTIGTQLDEIIAHRLSSVEDAEAAVLKSAQRLSAAELLLTIVEEY
ncbi:MAG: hypothetical protein RR413_09810 [Christensenellaceae bacterium]